MTFEYEAEDETVVSTEAELVALREKGAVVVTYSVATTMMLTAYMYTFVMYMYMYIPREPWHKKDAIWITYAKVEDADWIIYDKKDDKKHAWWI